MKLSGLSWRSCEGSKRVIGPLQAGRSTRNPATIETPGLPWLNMLLLLLNKKQEKTGEKSI